MTSVLPPVGLRARRSPRRPLLQPRTGNQYWWERRGIFNPGVAEHRGKVVLLYRAYDDHFISRFGRAESRDGVHFHRFPFPAVDTDPDDPYERLGIEDARITKIGKRYYVLHTSASYHPLRGHQADVRSVRGYIPWRVRVGMQTTTDFRRFRRQGVILPGVPAKNATLLPEKIHGAFGLYYREGSALKLSFTRDFRGWFGTKTVRLPHPQRWEAAKWGTGSPPVATKEGFLMVYHAVDRTLVYRLGLMLFDRARPWIIRWRTGPILEPETGYERRGFIPNIVYACGALRRGRNLWIYYGAGDRVVGRAVLPLPQALAL